MTTRTWKLAFVATIVITLAIFAIPNLLSTTYVKQRIADQLSQLTGRQVAIQGSSGISLRPYLGVSYDNVIISDDHDQTGRPLIAIEKFRAKLGLFAALFGDAELAEIELIRPHFHLVVDQNGNRNWLPNKGRIGAKIANNGSADALRLGTVRIEDGILDLTDQRNHETREFTAINGEFSWPDSNSAANSKMSAVWKGEVINLSASVAQPLELMRDGKTEISIKLNSNPLQLSFDGTCDGTARQFDGMLVVTTPSSKRFADWIDLPLQASKKLGSFSISGKVNLQNNSLEFPEALVVLENHQGQGRLQFSMREDGMFASNGTLAFDTIALPNFQNLLQTQSGTDEASTKLDLSILEGLALDVRLSANTATGIPFAMNNLAAAFIVNDGRASFDIVRAEAIGGSVSGSVTLQAQDESMAITTDLVGDNIELGQLTQVYSEKGVSLQGQGDIAIKLKSVGSDFEGLMLRLNGEGKIDGQDGTLTGLDLLELYETTLAGSDSVSRVSSATTDYQAINLGYFIANGTAFLRDSYLQTKTIGVELKGRIDLVRTTLALRGNIANRDPGAVTRLPFFVGGTPSSPLFVPLPTSIRPQSSAPRPEKEATSQ